MAQFSEQALLCAIRAPPEDLPNHFQPLWRASLEVRPHPWALTTAKYKSEFILLFSPIAFPRKISSGVRGSKPATSCERGQEGASRRMPASGLQLGAVFLDRRLATVGAMRKQRLDLKEMLHPCRWRRSETLAALKTPRTDIPRAGCYLPSTPAVRLRMRFKGRAPLGVHAVCLATICATTHDPWASLR